MECTFSWNNIFRHLQCKNEGDFSSQHFFILSIFISNFQICEGCLCCLSTKNGPYKGNLRDRGFQRTSREVLEISLQLEDVIK